MSNTGEFQRAPSSVAFTLDVYGHVLPGQQADAAAAVAALVDR